MKEYTSSNPAFSESIEIPEVTDTNHVNNLNPAPMQLLQNTLVNRKAIENIGQDITSSADEVYQQSTGYTDTKIAELINGAPSTLDTLGEIAQAMQENENVVDALDKAMGSKAPQAELDGHTGNSTIHITASERSKWNNKMEKTGDASNTTVAFTQASSLANISTGEKLSVIMSKVSKAIAALITHVGAKATGSTSGHVMLSDNYKTALTNGAAANSMGASQKAVANAYSALNNSLGGLEFAQDVEGNWGYKPAGADTVTPFKHNSGGIRKLLWTNNPINASDSNPITYTYDVKKVSDNYEDLTNANFYVTCSYMQFNGVGSYRHAINYNSSTGIVSVTFTGNASINSGYVSLYLLDNMDTL